MVQFQSQGQQAHDLGKANVFQFQCEGRRNPMSQFEGSQARGILYYLQ